MSRVLKKTKREEGPINGISRIGRHYRARDDAVGISPKLTASDKLYAKFSQFAYNVDDAERTRVELSANHPGWELMYNGNEDSVFINRGEKRMVFASKGTNPASVEDLKSDIKLTARPIYNWSSIPRMDESLQRYNYYKNLYKTNLGIDKFGVTGHSLGGGVALHIARFNPEDKAVVFNPALPATRAMDKVSIPNSRIIRTNYDMVSRGRTAVVDGERLTVPVSDGIRNPLNAHKMDHFVDDTIPKDPAFVDKVSTLYDEHAPKAFGAISTALTAAQLTGDIQNRDFGSFVKHSAEAAISTNPIGAVGVTAFEFGSSVARDIRAGDTDKAVKDTVEGAALSTGAFFGVPGLLVGGAVAGVAELGYRLLGHSNPRKPPSESIGGTVTESGLSLDHLGRTYAESLSGKADAAAAKGGLTG
jgi:pimeloyl-ACP methyl ester carboxylesterase